MKYKIILVLLAFAIVLKVSGEAYGQDTLMHFSFNEGTGSTLAIETISNNQYPIINLHNSPERIVAVQGNALRLDGFSTFIEGAYRFSENIKQISIEAWYATEAFPPSTDASRNTLEGAGIFSQIQNGAGLALEVGPYGNISLDFYADGEKYELKTARGIEKYVWNHIVATIDLTSAKAAIYLNGLLSIEMPIQMHERLSFADVPFYVGRHNSSVLLEGFNLTALNGSIDDIKVYNVALSEAEIRDHYLAFAPLPPAEIIFEDFEDQDFDRWTVVGNTFGNGPVVGSLEGQHPVDGKSGSRFVNSFHGGDGSQGQLTSPDFTISSDFISFLIGGGNHPGTAGVRLMIGEDIVRSASGNNAEILSGRSWNVEEFKGATAQIEIVDSVTGGWGHILADHITFNNRQALLPADLRIDPAVRHGGDYLRPQFHAMPATSWTNEPYGLTYYKGKYHLFFQKNPNGPWLHFMHWGHLSSPDLVNWQEEKVALAPSPGFDEFGVWSGTTIKDASGEPVIFYTGVDLGKAGIGVAFPQDDDLIHWEKYHNNPVIETKPAGYLDFRDPYVWEDNGTYYMIVGAGFQHDGGGALPTYKSTDLVNWSPINPLYRSSNLEEAGFFWEMPLFYKLNEEGDYLLAVTPLFMDKPANVIYWIGKWEDEKFTPYNRTPQLFEPVRDNMLAPAIGSDEEGRITYIGIIPETRNVEDQLAAAWRHHFSLPRVIRLLEDSTIGQYPHPNLCRLRENEISLNNKVIAASSNNNLPQFGGNQHNLVFNLKADSASTFSLHLLRNREGDQFTALEFDLGLNKITFDNRSGHAGVAERELKTFDYVFDYKEEINVEVFIDHSVVEFFIDNLLVISARVYPAESSEGIDLVVSGGEVEILEAKQWKMQSMGSGSATNVCEPSSLPEAFRKKLEDGNVTGLGESEDNGKLIKIYPNPAGDYLNIQLPEGMEATELNVLTLDGILVKSLKSINSPSYLLPLNNLADGIYLLNVKGRKFSEFLKVVIQKD